MAAMAHNNSLSMSLISGDGDDNHQRDGPHDEETAIQRATNTFQKGQIYHNIENLNKQAKRGEDGLCKLCEYLSNLPEYCLGPCSAFSSCLSIILLLLYLGGIIWLSLYDIYELQYIDIDDKSQTATVILECDQDSCLSNTDVCQYYGFQDCNNTNDEQASLTKFELSSSILIKIEYFIAWFMWVRLRFIMKDMSIFSIYYILLVILSNVISYMFRHLGWIYYSNQCKILYAPYFSDMFVDAIITFIISFAIWFILAMICLKRQNNRLVLRWRGKVVRQNNNDSIVDYWSVFANVVIALFFFYTTAAPALWIGIDNYQIKVQASINSKSNAQNYKSLIMWTEFLVTTVVQYFVPKIHWLSIYLLAAMVTNLLLIIDLITFLLKVIRDIIKKCKN